MIGKRFGRLTVKSQSDPPSNLAQKTINSKGKWYLCDCDCGKEHVVCGVHLRDGAVRSCGCLKSHLRQERLIGKKFNRLTIVGFSKKDGKGRLLAECDCDCGGHITANPWELQIGHTKSCGCWSREKSREACILRGPSLRKAGYAHGGNGTFRTILGNYRNRAKENGIAFELSDEEFLSLIQLPCTYCGCLGSNIINPVRKRGPFVYNGIDRINNTEGYTRANSVPCCRNCNYSKSTMTFEEFRWWAKALYFNLWGTVE